MEVEGEPLDGRAEPALEPLGPLEADVAKRSDVVAPDRDGKLVHVLSLGGPDASIGETMDSSERAYAKSGKQASITSRGSGEIAAGCTT
jgi:hypothetical protein